MEFTLTEPTNAITVRYSIPDSPSGNGQISSLNILVNNNHAINLTVTSIYSWLYGPYPFVRDPSVGSPRHFYDEARGLFGKMLPAGTTVC